MLPRLLLLFSLCGCAGGIIDKRPDGGDDTGAADTGRDSGSDTGADTADSGSDTGAPDSGDTGAETGAPDSGVDTGACAVDLPPAGASGTEPACATGVDPAPFEVEAEGSRLIYNYPRHTPVVGHAGDDDGDGRVGPGDHAELVAIDRYGGSFGSQVNVYGAGYETVWEQRSGWDGDIDPVFADLDGDGRGEIVMGGTGTAYPFLVAVDAGTGAEKWRSEQLRLDCDWTWCQTTAADIDGDGVAEVILDGYALDGATGAVDVTFELPDVLMSYRSPLAADLDGDGDWEVVIGDSAFDADGTPLWTFGGEVRTAHPALVQLDDDDEAEIALSLDYDVVFLDTDGTELFREALPGAERFGRAGLPCVGDLDGDGASEVVVPAGESLEAYEADGSSLWSVPMYGNDGTGWYSGSTGCSVFDFDRDGAVEVLIGDAMNLRIHDGRTGSTVWETEDYAAYMKLQVPVVADVDADGSAEILAVSTGHVLSGGESWMGLQVYGHPRDAWRTEGTVWGVSDFAVANQTAGGAMASEPAATWLSPGIFRGQLATPAGEPTALPGLTVEVVDTCAACDADEEHVAAVVSNVGAADAVDAAVELHAVARDGTSRVLDRAELGTIAAGTSAEGADLAWAPSAVARDERLLVVTSFAGDSCAVDGESVRIDGACR